MEGDFILAAMKLLLNLFNNVHGDIIILLLRNITSEQCFYHLMLENAFCKALIHIAQFLMLYFVCFRLSESTDLQLLFVFDNDFLLCLAYAIIVFDPVSLDKLP